MSTVMILSSDDVKEARDILGMTQLETSVALGNIRPETVSRWERSPKNEPLKMRGMNVITARQFTEVADLLAELFPKEKDRRVFLETPQDELDGKSPIRAILEDSPYGLRDVVRVLGRMAEGIPT